MKKLLLSIFSFNGAIGRKECLVKGVILISVSAALIFLFYLFTSSFFGIFVSPETFVRWNTQYWLGCIATWGAVVSIGLSTLFARRLNDIGFPSILALVLLAGHLATIVWFYTLSDVARVAVLIALIGADLAIPLAPKVDLVKKKEDRYEPGYVPYYRS